MTVAERIVECLEQQGCQHIFAISGAGNVFLFDAIANSGQLRYVCPHHEQAGVMAAVAYSRLTEPHRLGVMMTTGGPGAVNGLTGVLNAWADSIPILVLSGQEKLAHVNRNNGLRMWGVQGFDVVRAVSGFSKYAAIIDDPVMVDYHLERAIHEARSGRPGPVWLDIPMDIQSAPYDRTNQKRFEPTEPIRKSLSETAAKVRQMLEESERPAFILGNGIRLAGGIAEAEAVLRRYEIPVITGWSGMDMIPSDHPRHFGHAGVYGGRCANFLVQNADLLVCVGTRLAIPQVGYDFAEYARAAKKVVVDIDEAELRKFRPAVDLGVCADAKEFLTALLDTGGETLQRPAWMDQCAAWRRRYPILEPEHHISRPDAINTYAFMDAINRHIGKNDTLVADAGAAHTTTQQVAKIRGGQRIIATTGLGEMGYGLPAAVGAAFARPGGRVVLITGDGSMMLNLQELQTIVHHNLPITIFVYDNEGYLTIRNTQNALFKGRQAGSGTDSGVTCPDFLKIGEAFGMKTLTIRELEEAGECIEEAHREPGPVLCVVKCDAKQIFVPKLSLGVTESGEMVSPPLEDLSPLLPRETLAEEMLIGIHPKSVRLAAEPTPAEKVLP